MRFKLLPTFATGALAVPLLLALLPFDLRRPSRFGDELTYHDATAVLRPPGQLSGRISHSNGAAASGVLVTARSDELSRTVAVSSDAEGRFRLPDLGSTSYVVRVQQVGYRARPAAIELGDGTAPEEIRFTLEPAPIDLDRMPSSFFLGVLPDDEDKRKFILDCTGCHPFDLRLIQRDGKPKRREDWNARIEQMLMFAGANSAFPIMSAEREAEPTAAWLVAHLGGPEDRLPAPSPPELASHESSDAVITEYDLPVPQDLPHDLMVSPDGEVVVTGMFTNQLYRLDPASGRFTTEPIPVPSANPRAIDVAPDGHWWVLLGAPLKIARFDPNRTDWTTYDIGMYPHSVALDDEGRVWFNGHFTTEPELIGYLDGRTAESETFEVPGMTMPGGGSTVPYGLRIAPDGSVWGTELAGNRLFRFDPSTQRFAVHTLPTPHGGPRRLDVGPDGTVWIPEYSGNKLARFDPATETFVEFEFPIANALPYVVRVDQRRGDVWIGTAAADVMARFEPRDERFVLYRLPTRGALIRHIDVDERTGAVWGAYSPAPAIAPKVFRIELRN